MSNLPATIEQIGHDMAALQSPFVMSNFMGTGINPARHLKNLSVTTAPKVGIIGDSIATPLTTVSAETVETMWGNLVRAMVNENVGLDFEFKNYAIGGATYSSASPSKTLLESGLNLPEWADPSLTWLEHIEAEQFDVLFVAFGMNDRENAVAAQVRAFYNEVKSWSKVPDLILIPTMVPNTDLDESDSNYPNISSEVTQNGRLFNAHMIRSWAIVNDHALLDLNRVYCSMVHGFDPRVTGLTKADTVSDVTPIVLPSTEQDYGIEMDVAPSLIAGEVLRMDSGTEGTNTRTHIDLSVNGDGKLVVEVSWIEGDPYATFVSDVDLGSGTPLKVFFKDCTLSIAQNDTTIISSPIIRTGGIFEPKMAFVSNANITVEYTFWSGTMVKTKPMLSMDEMWGPQDGSNAVVGGNKKNHPTSLGGSLVYRALIDQQEWKAPIQSEGTTLYPNTSVPRVGMGVVFPQGRLHVAGNGVIGGYSPVSTASDLVVENPNSAGISIGAGSVCRINMGDAVDPDRGAINYVIGTDKLTMRAGGVDALSFIQPVSDGFTGATLTMQIDGVVVQKVVKVGDADSGGVGHRILRVTN